MQSAQSIANVMVYGKSMTMKKLAEANQMRPTKEIIKKAMEDRILLEYSNAH